jgi:radical SAM superfamily enzyme YgiQ (UPF0313 family)
MARVLLINADPVQRTLPPLGICYISESLEASGHKAVILDWGIDHTLPLDNIDFIGVSTTTLTYFDAREIIKQVKAAAPKIPVIIGGAHPSALPDFVLADSGADAVVVGEGERIMTEIADKRCEPAGIIYSAVIDDLDSLPFPRYKNINLHRYFSSPATARIRWALPSPSIAVMAKRGCPFDCTFCASSALSGRRVRFRTVANVMAELDFLKSEYGMRGVFFHDDTFTVKRSWTLEFCEQIARRKLKWICGTRVDMVKPDLLSTMRRAGCELIEYGIESGSERILRDVIKKGITPALVLETVRATKKAGIGVIANYMFGFPGETEDDMKATLSLVKKVPSDVAEVSIFMPMPGALLSAGYDWKKYSSKKNPFLEPSKIADDSFATMSGAYQRRAIRHLYMSREFLFFMVRKMLLRPHQMKYAFKSFLRLLRGFGK